MRALLLASTLAVGLSLGGAPGPAAAHGDHEDAPAAVPGVPLSPRLVAQSADFELVGVAQGRTLTLYLDRFVNNQPVTGAKIDVEVDGQSTTATTALSGAYTLSADWVAKPGRHDAIFTVVTDQGSDLLAGTLDIPAAVPATTLSARSYSVSQSPIASHLLAFLLGVLLTVALWQRAFLAAAVRGAADDARRRGAGLAAAAGGRVAGINAGVRRAALLTNAGFRSLGERGRPLLPQIGELFARIALSIQPARSSELFRQSAKMPDNRGRPLARTLRAAVPVWTRPVAGRVGTPAFAVIFVVAIVALALFLFGRGVLAHEGHEEAATPKPIAAATPAATPAAGGGVVDSGPHRLLDGSLFVPKESQRLLEVKTVVARTSEARRSVRMVGQVIADPGTSGEIHASMRGRLEPYNGAWPKVGQKVEVSDVLAWVVPVVNPIDRGIILQQVAQIDRQINLLQERLPGLTAQSGENSREVDDARSDLANLVRRRDAIAAVVRDRDTLRAPLLAPSSGIVAASFAVAGQVVDEQQKLFTVVDPKRLWVEAYAYDVAALGNVLDANAQGPTGSNYRLKFISRGPQLQRQTIPLYFQLDKPDSGLSVGSLVSVLVETGGERSGVILPRTAVTRSTSGQSIVWQHAHPESFVPIPVRAESIDGNNVLITAGLAPDTRVVVEAADLLNEVR